VGVFKRRWRRRRGRFGSRVDEIIVIVVVIVIVIVSHRRHSLTPLNPHDVEASCRTRDDADDARDDADDDDGDAGRDDDDAWVGGCGVVFDEESRRIHDGNTIIIG
jgi:hypothetical protein